MNNNFSSKYSLMQKASKTMFVAIALAAVIVSFSLVAINALWSQMSFNSKLNSAKEDVLSTLQQNKSNIEELKTSFSAMELGDELLTAQGDRSNSAVVLDALPVSIDLPALNTFVQNLALEAGVDVEAFGSKDFSASSNIYSPNPSPVEVPFNLTIKGDYNGIQRFLNTANRVIRPLDIQEIQLSGTDRNLTATMTIHTYYQPAVLIEPTKETLR